MTRIQKVQLAVAIVFLTAGSAIATTPYHRSAVCLLLSGAALLALFSHSIK